MKCSQCGHHIVEKTAKFCSECGQRLSVQPVNTEEAGDQPKSLVDFESEAHKSESEKTGQHVDSIESNQLKKRANDESIINPKKKKKKKSKNKKNGNTPLDQSLTSVADNQVEKPEGRRNSDSDSLNSPVNETSDSLEGQPSGFAANDSAASPGKSHEETTETTETSLSSPCEEVASKPKDNNRKKTDSDETLEVTPTDPQNQCVDTEENNDTTSQPGTGEGMKTTNPEGPKTGQKNQKSVNDSADTKQPKEDHNANVEQTTGTTQESKSKGKSQHGKRKQTTPGGQEKVFGTQTSSKTDSAGSSVDPEAAGGESGVQQSGKEKESMQTSDNDSSKKDGSAEGKESGPKTQLPPKKLTKNANIAASERMTIYFHAVLSKHFKFDPDVDHIFVRVGSCIGNWNENAAELCVERDLGEHGFLVGGFLTTTKNKAVSVSIPYKYVVYQNKKDTYEYEYIYKQDSKHSSTHTNRCLFVKNHLINENGDWHQYDDIICAPPSKNFIKSTWNKFWSEQEKSLIQGRNIAGNIMLGTIFDILRCWNETNLKSFMSQLNQFFHVYKEPFVYEEKQKKWASLDYSEKDVKEMLRGFMLTRVIPQLKDKDTKSDFIQDDLKAAVVMVHVRNQYHITLRPTEMYQLCHMLCLPKLEKDHFLQFWEDFSKEVSLIKGLKDGLVNVINIMRKEKMPRWLMVLPLVHLLCGTIKPFENPPPGNPRTLVGWAGLQGLDNNFPPTMSSQDKRALMNLMKNYSHLREVDSFSVRSCLYFMSLDELKECSSNLNVELLDILQIFLREVPSKIGSQHEAISEILSHIQQNLVEDKYSYFTEAYRKECLSSAVRLLEKISKEVIPTSYTQNYTDILVACMHLVTSVTNFVQCDMQQESQGQNGEQTHVRDLVSHAMSIMRDWMRKSFKQLLTKTLTSFYQVKATSEIEVWNNMISVGFKDKDLNTEWKQTFTLDFEGKYKQESWLDQIEFYCSNIEELSDSYPNVAASIEKCALEAVAKLCQNKSEGKLFERVRINWKFGKLVSAIIEKSWPQDSKGNYQEDEEVVLQHLLSWTAAKDIFKLHGADEKLIEKLSQVARDRIAIAISAFTAITHQLVQGSIRISLLNILLKRKDVYLALINIDCLSENGSYKHNGKMKSLLQFRQEEVDAVYYEKALVDILVTMSHKLDDYMTVDVKEIEDKQQVNIEFTPLDHFMEVHQYDQLPSELAGVVTYFCLKEEIRDMAEVLHRFRDSYLFKKCWDKQAKLLADEEMEEITAGSQVPNILATLEAIHENIFISCFEDYRDIYARLRDGTIRIEEVRQQFTDFKNNYEKLAEDMDIMCKVDHSNNKQWIGIRVQQIEQYHELHLAVASAQIIMAVKDTLHLQGDFRVLETLTKVTHADFQKEQLQRIDNDLMQAKKVLVDITEPRRLCLQELGSRGHFVKWVKSALEDINELKVFVDLASISAGENDMDVDRVACFHDAVLGYSSLLYELKPDSGFDAFKEVLTKLWRALENDGNLPKKLRDSARHLEWLKTVKDCHGSVELSSLSLASTINHKGIYMINAHCADKLSLDTSLKLHIQEEHDDGHQMRSYSLEDLRELQNKLMLMSGKGDQGQNEVDHFAEVFASVQRLAEAFIALYNAGNPLFRQWEVQINCSSNSQKPSIMMDFNLENVPTVTVEGSIEELLPELCRKMEKCLKYWMDFVLKQRSQNYYLNYFTSEQIVFLCRKLIQQNVTSIEDQVLMMLSFIKPNCSTIDLRHVWHALQYEILTKPQDKNEDLEFQTFVVLQRSGTEEQDFSSQLSSMPSCVVQSNGLSAFDRIWNSYMKDMKDFLPHILDIKTLGRLLEILANKSDKDEIDESKDDHLDDNFIKRQLPKGLVTGRPNLIVCPHDDVLTCCISIYMNNKDVTLPTYDEVLLCNSSTPYEQVELFLRRCLSVGYRGRKIYALLYGDLLAYDVSSKVESFFQEMKMKSRNDYQLVVICSSEREHAYLPSAFSQYKVHMVPQESLARVQTYLHKHYAVPSNQHSAAAVFKDRLCVGIISSKRAGVGKSLYIKRLYETLEFRAKRTSAKKCIRLIEPCVNENTVVQSLLDYPKQKELTMFHFDVMSSVQRGLSEFLFKLLILRYLMDSEGKIWKCNNKHLYVIEILEPTVQSTKSASGQAQILPSTFTDVFPKIVCRSPKEVLMLEMMKHENPTVVSKDDPLMDEEEFRSETFQRPYQYLTRFHNHKDLDAFSYEGVEGSHVECLQMLLMNCGIMDPSWAELRNFARFLNLQLKDCETSVFCDATVTGDTLMGFKTFVVDFMILMAKDFATPSLQICDQSPGRLPMHQTGVQDEDLAPFLIRKRWETEPHPYIFFNDDHVSMTFIGFHLQLNEQGFVDAIDPTSKRVIKKNAMTKVLYEGLQLQRVPFNIDFDSLPRWEKIERICNVLGIQWALDPDETYELTTDNILKILAIHMRFRCGIPVIIMGETGCGKTRLIKFLCKLRRSGVASENMKLVKVHGGTTSEDIFSKVKEAESIASINKMDYGFDTVLFFDEANTTEAISSIKEVLCDNTVKGESVTPSCGLQIIAACNPYRKHTDEMIQRLESAGLGYRVRADETDEKLGSIPLRQLVYRVQALPPSMIPLVWDFGQLDDHTEKIYIQQIVQRVVETKEISVHFIPMITDVLSVSQKYMRTRKDECSFVSLRDVERCMQAFVWFYDNHVMFFAELEELESIQKEEKKERPYRRSEVRDPVIWSLVMATGVCYHACLEVKDVYREQLSSSLRAYSPIGVMQEISLMQDLLLNGVPMGDTIARNNALKENVFMMVLCIELRIPLFLVGKPGSSKSLSKTLVADAMQGQAAHSDLYKRLKQIHMVSFQCSPHSTPEGIINTFKQCGRFQEGKNLDEYISVVVLDEIGLAEDSPKMPLKTLHPLLEEGCIDDEPQPHKKVGFIGISNWALDPAKMNRGIFVSRGDPDRTELVESAKGICSSDPMVLEKVSDFFQPFARAYLDICSKQGKGFFGLRDYYSLIKMIFALAKTSQRRPTAEEIAKAVLRNFSGKDNVDAVTVFAKRLQIVPNLENISAIEFVRENIQATGQDEECRYLLVLTKNYAALQILQQTFFSGTVQPEIIFGSSFPKDQEYTQICRNINRVKICMETGKTVVLLNLQNLYESLYDALNQYYVSLGGQKYVDLGLGTHRVKCRVHKDFRLIVIEEREVVYKQFPIPLINRLEKHFLDIHTVLRTEQKRTVEKLEKWVNLFVSLGSQHAAVDQTYKYQPPDVFIGYHTGACASVVLEVAERQKGDLDPEDAERRLLDEAKLVLLKCATPDSVVRLDCTGLPKVESEELARNYFEEQSNNCLADYILAHTKEVSCRSAFTEVTTFSRLLTAFDLEPLKQILDCVELLSLQQFDTEHSFLKKIRNFLTAENMSTRSCNRTLIIQCSYDDASHSVNLIASAKYSSLNEINKITQEKTECNVFVYFITRLPRMQGGTTYIGFHGGPWKSVHIDDLRKSKDIVFDIKTLQNMTISKMFETKTMQQEAMEIDDVNIEKELDEAMAEENDCDSVVDTTALLRSCVQSAVGMLRDNVESGSRSTQRVEILLTLLSDDDRVKGKFMETVKSRLHSLLKTQESNTFSPAKNNWVLKEASNIDALQEGGTFKHTLWKRVQAAVSPLLAHLVSVIDRDQNMDLLLDGNIDASVKKLWLDIFTNDKLLEMSHLKVDHNSDTRTILVQNYIAQDRSMSCSMPFSWRIKDYLEELWVHALQCEGHTQEQFDDFFGKTPLGRYIAEADPEMQTEFFYRYLQDFVCMTMNVSREDDLRLLCNALQCCVNEMRSQLDEPVVSLPWVHAAYHKFKIRLQNLYRMICIEPQVTKEILSKLQVRDGAELVHDVYAAFACVEHLDPKVLDIDIQRHAWLRNVKKLQVPIELVCSEDSVRHYGARSKALISRVQAGWNRIHCVSLFVEHVLLGIEELERKLAPLVLKSTRALQQILEHDSDLKTQPTFEAVIALLKNCKQGAIQCIFRFGLPHCPVCLRDPRDPLCLPCQHIFCVECAKQWLGTGQMYCPFCMQPVSDDFPLVPSDDIRISINLHAQMRKQCNAFFIDLVSTVCFKDNSPPCSAVIQHLLSFLMVEADPVPILRASGQVLTKVLSPFDDSVDQNPVIRSVVLKLLLKYSFDEVKDYLQQHLMAVERNNILDETDKIELYCLYINCLEDSMFDRVQFRSAADQHACLCEESHFLTEYLESRAPDEATVEFFQQVARVRMDLDVSARLFEEEMRAPGLKEESQRNSAFLSSVVNLCRRSGNDWYRIYLIRKICSQSGVEFVLQLLKVEEMHWLFPEEILQKTEEVVPVDHYLVCGEDYQTIRDAVAKGVMEGNVDELDKACEGCSCLPHWKTVNLLLALYREVTTLYRDTNPSFHPKPEQVNALVAYIQTSKTLNTNEAKAFAQCLVTNQLGPLVIPPGSSTAHCVLVDLTVHFAAVLACGNMGILTPLQQLAKTPANMQGAFLPTMPEDMLAVAQQALGLVQWYHCPNGHPCTIGECGQPMERSYCLDCRLPIGGDNHRPLQGFHQVQLQGDRTQRGHILGDPGRRDNPDMLDTKSLSPVPFTMIRMFTHMAMLIGTSTQPQFISAIIKPPVEDAGAFLLAHLSKDMQHLMRSLGKGTDDTISVVHLLINSLLEFQQQQNVAGPHDKFLSTKEARNKWEEKMSSEILTPHLKHLDRQLKEVNAFIRADSRISANPIMKLIFGDPRLFLTSLPQDSVIHRSAVWSSREKVSLLSLTHIVEQNDGKDTLPVLWRFLHKEAELRLVKHLPDIITLQRDLVKKFQNVTELSCNSIAEFLHSQKTGSLKAWYEKHIRIFMTTWNQLRVSLETNGEIKIPAEFCQKDLDDNSDFRVLLPRRQGPGLCSTALVSYLVALHNDLIYCVDKNTGEETSYKVSPADLTELHVIHYEVERDVMPLILANTQYSIEKGQETIHEYNLSKMQQQVISRFLQGKPLITLNGIPTLINRHDRNYEIILKDVKTKISQEPLQTLTLVGVSGELHSYSDVCEALHTLEVALGFLAMTGGEPHMQLSCYLVEVLQMGNQMAQHVLKALSVCCLKHCVALWQLLASLKSEHLLQLRRDPFPVSEKYKKPLGEDECKLLTGFFSKNSADGFLLEMHEFLVLVLKKPDAPDTYRPDWSLRDTVVSYMECKDVDIPPEVEENFPEEISLGHYVEAWKFIVEFKHQRGPRQ